MGLKTNSFKIVGKLTAADTRTGVNKRGHEFISVSAVVTASLEGKDNEFDLSFYSEKMTKDGKPSQLYTSYEKMPELIGHKIEVTGDLRENRYYSTNLKQIISSQQLNGRFVRGTAESTTDEASYEISGFIAKEVIEKVNKNNEVYRYDLTLGLPNWNDSGLSMFTLHVDPSATDILRGVKGYHAGDTVRVNGNLRFFVTTVEKTENHEGGFGAPVTKVYTNKQKNFFITGGSAPLTGEDKFDSTLIRSLIDAYKAHDVELSSAAESTSTSSTVADAPVTSRQTSLI